MRTVAIYVYQGTGTPVNSSTSAQTPEHHVHAQDLCVLFCAFCACVLCMCVSCVCLCVCAVYVCVYVLCCAFSQPYLLKEQRTDINRAVHRSEHTRTWTSRALNS